MALVDREWPVDYEHPDGTKAKIDFGWGADSDPVPRELRIEVLTTDGMLHRFDEKAIWNSFAAAVQRGKEIVDQFVVKRGGK